jgi:iron-sulfur cluster repair protein YtfE (RIC family)
MNVSAELDVMGCIAERVNEHRQMLGARLTSLRALSADATAGNPQVPGLTAMDQKVAFFANDLRECFTREESMVFPALLRLQAQVRVSHCQAGAVKARLRLMTAEQNALATALAEISEIATRHLSPGGPCESCHELVAALESLQVDLNTHFGNEQDVLFHWAHRREEALISLLD